VGEAVDVGGGVGAAGEAVVRPPTARRRMPTVMVVKAAAR